MAQSRVTPEGGSDQLGSRQHDRASTRLTLPILAGGAVMTAALASWLFKRSDVMPPEMYFPPVAEKTVEPTAESTAISTPLPEGREESPTERLPITETEPTLRAPSIPSILSSDEELIAQQFERYPAVRELLVSGKLLLEQKRELERLPMRDTAGRTVYLSTIDTLRQNLVAITRMLEGSGIATAPILERTQWWREGASSVEKEAVLPLPNSSK